MYVLFFTRRFPFLVRHLDFPENGASDKVEMLDPENIRVDNEIMFVSRRIPKLKGGYNFGSPLAVRAKKFGRLSEGKCKKLTFITSYLARCITRIKLHSPFANIMVCSTKFSNVLQQLRSCIALDTLLEKLGFPRKNWPKLNVQWLVAASVRKVRRNGPCKLW